MPSQKVVLDVASFLDSDPVKELGVERDVVSKIATAFLSVCYDEMGLEPRLLDGEHMHEALGHRLPGHFARRDPLADHVPVVLEAYLDHLQATRVVTQAFEVRQAFSNTIDEFQSTVRTGQHAHHAPTGPQTPKVNRAPKLGRNDPCFCGSGKKFKKCHGK